MCEGLAVLMNAELVVEESSPGGACPSLSPFCSLPYPCGLRSVATALWLRCAPWGRRGWRGDAAPADVAPATRLLTGPSQPFAHCGVRVTCLRQLSCPHGQLWVWPHTSRKAAPAPPADRSRRGRFWSVRRALRVMLLLNARNTAFTREAHHANPQLSNY